MNSRPASRIGIVARWIIGGLVVLLLTTCLWPGLPAALLFGTVLGWFSFLRRTIPQIQPDWSAVGLGAFSLLLFGLGLHWFLSWFYAAAFAGEQRPSDEPRSQLMNDRRMWSARWTLSIVAIVVMMFVAGISMVGITHQVAWLATSEEPLVRNRFAESLQQIKLRHSAELEANPDK